MANKLTVQHKRSSVAGNKPVAATISVGELAINFADKTLYTKDAANAIIDIGNSKWTTQVGGISRADKITVGASTAPASAIDMVGTLSHAAAVTTGIMDLNLSDRFSITVGANVSLSFSGVPAARATEVVLKITNGGAFSVGWPAGVTWISGTAPSLKASGIDLVNFWTHDGGTTWWAEATCSASTSTASAAVRNWIAVDSKLTGSINIYPANGKLIATGPSGQLSYSSDGVTWTKATTGVAVTLGQVAYGNGLYVVSRAGGGVLTSPDLITWTARATGAVATVTDNIIFDGAAFVGTNKNVTVRSLDGITWTSHAMAGFTGSSIAYGNGVYVVSAFPSGTSTSNANKYYTSTDGMTWTQRNAPATVGGFLQSVKFNAKRGEFMVVTTDLGTAANIVQIGYSTDGITWAATNSTTDLYYGATSDGFDMLGSNGYTSEYHGFTSTGSAANWLPNSTDPSLGNYLWSDVLQCWFQSGPSGAIYKTV